MPGSAYIKTLSLALVITGLNASETRAAELTLPEKTICPALDVCVDIIRRHTAIEFDYDVLEAEFKRFGRPGRAALFDVLHSKVGNSDVAAMISRSGPLSSLERSKIKQNWTLESAETYLPLLRDGHPVSRDLLLLTLGSARADVRETARIALFQLPKTVERQPISQAIAKPLLSALSRDVFAEAAPYVKRLNPRGHGNAFTSLLRSGETDIVYAAYTALHRDDPLTAFKSLLSEMSKIESAEQSQAMGDMLLRRHANRSDGFYLNFARDISGDKTRPIPARASGLHAVLVAGEGAMPDLTPERAEALAFLIAGQPFVTQDKYLPFLKRAKAEDMLAKIWTTAKKEKWINLDRISLAFQGTDLQDKVITDLLRSDDVRSVSFGLTQARPVHNNIIRGKIDHPLKAISAMARRALKLPAASVSKRPCIISNFDSNDQVNQMPFFEGGWMKADNKARVNLDRKYLTSAHAARAGWLAGYNLEKPNQNSIYSGGALVHYDNKTGGFQRIGDFAGPVAILPNKSLKLGETTNRFWVIDSWGGDSDDVSAYSVDITQDVPKIMHLGALPKDSQSFTVAPNGDLLMRSSREAQAPIRMSPRGDISFACRSLRPVNGAPAPN